MKKCLKLLLLGIILSQTTNANDLDFYHCTGSPIDLKFVRTVGDQNLLKIKLNGQPIETESIEISDFEDTFMVSVESDEPDRTSFFLNKPTADANDDDGVTQYHAFSTLLYIPMENGYQLHRLRCTVFGLTFEQLDDLMSIMFSDVLP